MDKCFSLHYSCSDSGHAQCHHRATAFSTLMMRSFLLLSFLFPIAYAQYGDYVISQVISVYDGDTIRVHIYDLPPIVGDNIRIRLRNIDTPEITGQCLREKQLAILARNRLRELVAAADLIEIHNVQRGKYFRIVADLILDGTNASHVLLREKLGVPYNGGKKTHRWCQ